MKHEFWVQWVGWVCSLQKILTRLRGTNFCTTSARFAPSFVRQPNGTKCTQIVRNAPKYEFRSQRGNRVCSLRKIMMRLRAKNFCASSARFALSFVRQLNGPKCMQMVRNATKHEFRVHWCESRAFVAKNSDATLWHEHLHLFGTFCSEIGKATKWSQMHQNGTKLTKT